MKWEPFFAERLSLLRMQKKISARFMSLELGQSESYINAIENKRAFPSMDMFFRICEYLDVTPQEFFDGEINCPDNLREMISEGKKLSPSAMNAVIVLLREMNRQK